MKSDPDPVLEDEFTKRLAAGEEAVWTGTPTGLTEDTPAELRIRLLRGLACVQRLQQLRPSQSVPSPPLSLNAEDGCPARIGRFEIRGLLGRGGFGLVYRAYDPVLCRDVALKIPRADVLVDADSLTRFQREARAAAGLDHPNLVPVHEAGQLGPICYIAFAYCPGSDLAAWLKQRTTPVRCVEAARLVSILARAIHHAHRSGILHRDLKPSNVLLSPVAFPATAPADDLWQPETNLPLIPRVTDFGLAKFAAGDQARTQTGHVFGTPGYMAPEQVEPQIGPIGPAADVYALGAILYEVLTGRPPFWGESPMAIMMQVKTVEPVPPSRLRPELPRDLETICLKCLHKEPRKRYRSAAELADDLQRFLKLEPIMARRIGPVERSIRWCRRNPRLALVMSSAAAIILILTIGYYASLISALDDAQTSGRRTSDALTTAEKNRRESDRQRGIAEKNSEELAKSSQDLVLERDETEKLRQLALKESDRAKDSLCRSLFEQAHSLRISNANGRRWKTLDLLAQAETLRIRKRGSADPPLGIPAQTDLRSEAVAALLLHDAVCVLDRNDSDVQPFISDDGRLAHVPRINRATREGGLELLDLAAAKGIARFDDIFVLHKNMTVPELGQEINSRAHSPRGKWLALRGKTQVRLWQFPEGKASILDLPSQLCNANNLGFKALLFSPRERFLAGIRFQDDRTCFLLWDLTTSALKNLGPTTNLSPVPVVAFSPNDRYLAYASADKKITLWSLKTQQASYLDLPEQPYALLFSPDEQMLIVHCIDAKRDKATCVFWNLEDRKTKERQLRPKAPGQVAVMSRTARLLAYCVQGDKADTRIAVHAEAPGASPAWNLDERNKNTLKAPAPPLKMIFSADERFLAAAFGDPWADRMTYIVWDMQTFKEKARFVSGPSPGRITGMPGPPMFPALSYSPKSDLLAVGHGMGHISTIDLGTGKETFRLESAHKTPVIKIVWQPDGRHLTSVTRDGSIKIWKLSENCPTARIQPENYALNNSRFVFSPDGQWLAAQVGRMTQLIERSTGKVARELPVHGPMFFRADSRKLAVLVHERIVRRNMPPDFVLEQARATVMDVAAGSQDAFLDVEVLQSAAFGPGGDLLVVRAKNEALEVWNVNSKSRVWQAPADARLQYSMLSPDGLRAFGLESREGSTRLTLWEPATGVSLSEATMPRVHWFLAVPAPILSPDGRWAAVPMKAVFKMGNPTGIYRLPSLEKSFELPPNLFPVPLAFSPDSRYLAQSHLDGAISLWHIERGKELFRWQAAATLVENLSFTPEGDLAFAEKKSPHLQVLRLADLRRRLGEFGLGW